LIRFIQPEMPLVWLTRSRLSPYAWIVIFWAVMTLPAIFLVGARPDEGTTLGFARGAFEGGHWLAPDLYGYRIVDRPALVSWLLGALGLVTGEFDLWVGRLPAVFALLATAILIYWFTRRVVGGLGAAFAAGCFLLAPMIIQKLVSAESDGIVSLLLFVAFVLWWIGSAGGGPSFRRWLLVGIVLAVAGLVKGPQPLGFFFIGVGLYLAVRGKWREFAAMVATGLMPAVVIGAWYWLVYEPGDLAAWQSQLHPGTPGLGRYLLDLLDLAGHLVIELMPGLILAVPLVVDLWRRRIEANRELVLALVSYGGSCAAIFFFWPGVSTRYAMPAVPAVAVLAGIAYHHFLARLPRLVLVAQIAAGGLLLYVLVLNWLVMPLFPGAFAFAAGEAEPLTEAILERPAPVYVVPFAVSRGILYYLPKPHLASVDELAHTKPPFWAILTPADEERLKAMRPELALSLRLQVPKTRARLVDVLMP
jgi:4-amino-4-deoxy-L-arabinose transferase-like glycosyltransferase